MLDHTPAGKQVNNTFARNNQPLGTARLKVILYPMHASIG